MSHTGFVDSKMVMIHHISIVGYMEASFCQLDTNWKYLGKLNPQLRNCLHQPGLETTLIDNWCGRGHTTVGGVILGQIALGYTRQLTKPVISIPLWSLLQFLLPISCLGFPRWYTIYSIWAKINSFHLWVGFNQCFIPATENKLEQAVSSIRQNLHPPTNVSEGFSAVFSKVS